MRTMQASTVLLVGLLIFVAFGCGVSMHQRDTYEGCMSRCDQELEHCVRGCYTPARMWSDTKTLRCVDECNQKKAECERLCSKFNEPFSR